MTNPSSTAVFEQPVMWPTASAVIGSTKALRLAEHRALKDCTGGSGSCELTIADQAGLVLPDVDAFIAASPDAKPLVPVTLSLGYKGFDEWTVFTGWLAEAEYGPRRLTVHLSVLDDIPLRATRLTEFAVQKDPQTIVEELLKQAGWSDYEVDLIGAASLKKNVEKNETVLDLLNRLADTAKIRFPWWIDAEGKFRWTPWSVLGTEKTYIFRRQVNVVGLRPGDQDETASDEANKDKDKIKPLLDPGYPPGPQYELETIPHPWLGPWQVIKLEGYEKAPARAKDGLYRVETIEHRGGSESRSVLTIRRLEDE